MKKILFSFFALSNSLLLYAQERPDQQNPLGNNTPTTIVQQSFQQDNPHANNVTWHRDTDRWHAGYIDEKARNIDTYYDPNGNRIETHTVLNKEDIPSEVDAIVSPQVNINYNPHNNYYAERIDRPNQDAIYKVIYHKKKKDKIFYFNEHGKKKHYHEWMAT